ncbi:hypothetical protein N7495_006591 [Penicillium taxi]|uniref:uncharacterized protein n=1 Tax=Penicillium taxi TaxID=168475 RepID=UPI00254500A4|nr:uncharacterized protein N7495_006591 [Penicillium taxi]KAJ5894900.1 hypothetical protein N7495_006591 [Penicillium taxi]
MDRRCIYCGGDHPLMYCVNALETMREMAIHLPDDISLDTIFDIVVLMGPARVNDAYNVIAAGIRDEVSCPHCIQRFAAFRAERAMILNLPGHSTYVLHNYRPAHVPAALNYGLALIFPAVTVTNPTILAPRSTVPSTAAQTSAAQATAPTTNNDNMGQSSHQ